MALTAYALALVDSLEKFNANDRLKQRAIYDNGLFKIILWLHVLFT